MRISEKKAVEDPVLRACAKRWPALQHYKMNGMGKRSWPDQMFMIPGGKPFFIEFKSPGEEPTPLQWVQIRRMQADGYEVSVFDDKDEALAAIERRVTAALRHDRRKAT